MAEKLYRSASDGRGPAGERCLGGFLVRKYCWVPSARAWLVMLMIAALAAWGVFWQLAPFLAITERVPSEVLVFEGWCPPSLCKQTAAEFQGGHYKHLLLLRPVLNVPDRFESGRYSADYMANLLLQDGVPKSELTVLTPFVAKKDRTYHSALDAKQWLEKNRIPAQSIDVATDGPHARRSRLLYQKAFGIQVKVGIIAMQDPMFDTTNWWHGSEGVREVVGEAIAYGYSRF